MELIVVCEKPEYRREFLDWSDLAPEIKHLKMVTHVGLPKPMSIARDSLCIFIMDYRQVAGQSWLDALAEMNPRGASSLFLINEKEFLSEDEHARITTELSAVLGRIVPRAHVGIVSTSLAIASSMLASGRVGVNELARTRSVMAYMASHDLGHVPDPGQLFDFSGFKQIISRVSALAKYTGSVDSLESDTSALRATGRNVCAVVSTRSTGKTMICRALEPSLPEWAFVERTVTPEMLSSDELVVNADAVIVVTDDDYERDLHACTAVLTTSGSWLVLNRSDDYAKNGRIGQQVLKGCVSQAQELGVSPDHILLASAYYDLVAHEFRSGKRRLESVIYDPEVVLVDEWQLPLIKSENIERLEAWLAGYRGLDHIRRELGGAQ